MPEEEQLAILGKEPVSDLPVFIFKLVCDRGITHEVVRHRVLSFTQESTRYVNYKNKGMILILPEEIEDCYDSDKEQFVAHNALVETWTARAETIFEWYRDDLNRGLRPEIARDILPNLLKSEIFVSGRWSGWRHFIQLRDSQQAHPRIRSIAREVRNYFDSLGIG
jgi:thymidylate synthase (FAD)